MLAYSYLSTVLPFRLALGALFTDNTDFLSLDERDVVKRIAEAIHKSRNLLDKQDILQHSLEAIEKISKLEQQFYSSPKEPQPDS